jgi:hypothetical protein
METKKQKFDLMKTIEEFSSSSIAHFFDHKTMSDEERLEQRLKSTVLEPTDTENLQRKYHRTKVMLSEFKVGDLLDYFGVIARVQNIKIYPNHDQPERPIYIFECVYVEGDELVFKSINRDQKTQVKENKTFRIHGVNSQLLDRVETGENARIAKH